MMTVKKFNFPTFEGWNKGNEWSQKIGSFTCRVATVGWGCNGNTKNDYQIAISKSDNPLNIYSPKLFNDFISCDVKDNNSLQYWYENAIKNANSKWEKYILETYFEE